MTQKATEFCAASGIAYRAEFVPQSKSRNADKPEPCLNWRVMLEKNGHVLVTDYMQGCAHVLNYEGRFPRSAVYADAVKRACETGKSRLRKGKRNAYDACAADLTLGSMLDKPQPLPTLADVLYCLVSDSDAMEHATFEEWAGAFGYDPDSRAAEKIYRACLETALTLRHIVDLDAAREAFQDY